MYLHLTTHSAYSLKEGLALPAELAQAAAANGMPALGLTDHRLLSGTVEFVAACRVAGVQPLLGLEIDLETRPLSLLAMDLSGWANLCTLSSTLALRPDPEAPCPLDLLAGSLIALSGPQGDPAGNQLGLFREIFPKRLYLTLQDPAISLPLADFGCRLSLPLVVSHPIYYLNPEQAGVSGGGAGVDSPSKAEKTKSQKNSNLAGRIPTVGCMLCLPAMVSDSSYPSLPFKSSSRNSIRSFIQLPNTIGFQS